MATACEQIIARIECLYETAWVIENRYFAQTRQHYARPTAEPDEQLPLWDNDPPF